MQEPVALSPELLAELHAELVAQDAPILRYLRPGLSSQEIDELTRPLGLRLPAEAKQWWSWHDGAGAAELHKEIVIGPGYQFRPLAYAVERALAWRRERDSEEDGLLDDWWLDSWIEVVSGEDPLVFDCSDPDARIAPVVQFLPHDGPGESVPSFGAVVEQWIEALRLRAWEYTTTEDAKDGRWFLHSNRMPRRTFAAP